MVALGDHVDLLTGYPFKSARYTEAEADIRLLRGDNVAQAVLRWDGVKRWPVEDRHNHTSFELAANDVILAMDRPWISAGLKYAWIKESDLPALLVQRVARMRGANGLDTTFLRYVIGSQRFTEHVLAIITGVNVPHISPRDIKAFTFALPPLDTQKRIVRVLSAYDDLMENNTRRIAILEEMARRLYEEWFVYFRFPGHETTAFVDTPDGRLPEGWHLCCVNDLAWVNPEQITIRNAPERITYIDISAVSTGRITPQPEIDFAAAPGRARRVVLDGDTIWSCVRPNRRSFALVQAPIAGTIVSTGFAVLRAREPTTAEFLHLLVTRDSFVDYLTNHATGAAYPAVTAATFEAAPAIHPTSDVLLQFANVTRPVLRLAHQLERQNANLRTQRDVLLPKLVSGEIDLVAAEALPMAAE